MSESLVVKIGADIKGLQSAMVQVSASVQNAGKNITNLGKTVSTRLTAPLVLLGGVALKAFAAQEQAELRLRAALNANGRVVNHLFNRYNSFAQEMQRTTVIGDETTLAMLAQAESLGLTGDSAERAVKNSIAMQGAFGVNAESALRYTAALEEGNATMLSRYIPTLRGIEDESEKAAEAQRVLTRAFTAAEAEANGVAGTFKQVKNAIGDAMEDIGKNIADAFNITGHKNAIIENIAAMRNFFASLSAEARRNIVLITAAILGIGPAIITIGITISTLGVIIGALTSPITLVVAFIAGLGVAILFLRDNWEAVVERISDIGWWKNTLISMAQFVLEWTGPSLIIKGWNAVITYISDTSWFQDMLINMAKSAASAFDWLDIFDDAIAKLDKFKSDGFEFNILEIPNVFEDISEELEKLKVETKDYEHEIGSLSDAFINAIEEFTGINIRGMFNPVTAEASKLFDETEMVKLNLQLVKNTAISVSKAVVPAIGKMKEEFFSFKEAIDFSSKSLELFLDRTTSAFTNAIFMAKEFNTDELELRRFNLGEQVRLLKESLSNQEISMEEYTLRIAILNNELLDVEQEINKTREGLFVRSMKALVNAAKSAVKEILAEFLKLAIIKGIGAIFKLGGITGAGGLASELFSKLFKKTPKSPDEALSTLSGSVVKFNSADDILTSNNMDKVIGGGGRVEVFGKLVGEDIFISSNRGSKTYGR